MIKSWSHCKHQLSYFQSNYAEVSPFLFSLLEYLKTWNDFLSYRITNHGFYFGSILFVESLIMVFTLDQFCSSPVAKAGIFEVAGFILCIDWLQ